MKPLMSLEQVADALAIHPNTIRGWMKKGEGPKGFKVGRNYRFRPEDIDAFITGKLT